MDKQKQIKEMVDLYIQHAILEFDKHGFSAMAKQMYIDKLRITMFEICSVFFEAGYRKIPENAVVLTREEWEKLNNAVDSVQVAVSSFTRLETLYKIKCKELELSEEKTRKETAEKFYSLANERIAKEQGKRDGYEAFRIDDKSSYDGDIISLILFEICNELINGAKTGEKSKPDEIPVENDNGVNSGDLCVSRGKYAGEGRHICINCEKK